MRKPENDFTAQGNEETEEENDDHEVSFNERKKSSKSNEATPGVDIERQVAIFAGVGYSQPHGTSETRCSLL